MHSLSSPNILVVIVTYNASSWVEKCFESLRKSSIPLTVFVVDNLSKDDTLERIKNGYSEVILSESKENLGFGRANNLGLKKAISESFDFVFLLNQDAWIFEDTLSKLLDFYAQNQDYGILSPMQLTSDGQKVDKKFQANLISQQPDVVSDLIFQRYALNYDVNFANAAAWLIPVSCLRKVGGFDPFFFMYGEDTEYCKRVLFHKLKIGVVTSSAVIHARDNHFYKKLPLGKRIIFNKKEYERYLYQHLKDVNFSFKENVFKTFKNLFLMFIKKIVYLDVSVLIAIPIAVFGSIFKFGSIRKNRVLSQKNGATYL